ncbi:dephospho-CoA kinase [Candidatus Nomurabacteria bacterium]|nr:dephospho-CoA kinase [Candidatus Kaiserbacteria bacterium]MCB9814477.1 dephospho-CoA kinase [Candidatus Nomurabacteria bacterium]
MQVIGLTGNIGCGKSTVSSLLSRLPQVLVVDSDSLAKTILSDQRHKNSLQKILGEEVFESDTINFKRVAQIIFHNKLTRVKLEKFIHPLVWTSIDKIVKETPSNTLVIVESAIIYETKMESYFGGIIVVTCPTDVQFSRLTTFRGMSSEQIKARLSQQISSAEKVVRANYVIDTDCTLDELKQRVFNLYKQIKGGQS